MATNPNDGGKIVWPAYQTYADGERFEWTGEQGSKRPASVTTLAQQGRLGSSANVVGWAALALAVVSLGLGIPLTIASGLTVADVRCKDADTASCCASATGRRRPPTRRTCAT
jgi:hypothetical protein